jgi:hypothetical protein
VRGFPAPLRAFLLASAAALAWPTPSAFAGDATPAPAATPLSAPEMEVVRRRFPEWDRLDEAKREKIVRSVVGLRSLTPEQKQRLIERSRKVDPLTIPDRLEKFGALSPAGKGHWRLGWDLERGIAMAVLQGLPPGARALLEPGSSSLPDVDRLEIAGCIVKTWMGKAKETTLADPPFDLEPSVGAPERVAAAFVEARDAAVRAGGAQAPLELRRRFVERFFEDRKLAALRRVPRAEPGHDPRTRMGHAKAMAAYLKEQFPAAFEATSAVVAEAARGGAEGLASLCSRQDPAFLPARARRLAALVWSLEMHRDAVASLGPDAVARSDALEAAALGALKVPDDLVRRLLEAKGPARRDALLAIGAMVPVIRGEKGGRQGPPPQSPPAGTKPER